VFKEDGQGKPFYKLGYLVIWLLFVTGDGTQGFVYAKQAQTALNYFTSTCDFFEAGCHCSSCLF
jgi:hypothetical protein